MARTTSAGCEPRSPSAGLARRAAGCPSPTQPREQVVGSSEEDDRRAHHQADPRELRRPSGRMVRTPFEVSRSRGRWCEKSRGEVRPLLDASGGLLGCSRRKSTGRGGHLATRDVDPWLRVTLHLPRIVRGGGQSSTHGDATVTRRNGLPSHAQLGPTRVPAILEAADGPQTECEPTLTISGPLMKVAIAKETAPLEQRVALVPDVVGSSPRPALRCSSKRAPEQEHRSPTRHSPRRARPSSRPIRSTRMRT